MSTQSIIQHNRSLKTTIFENNKELRNIQARLRDELRISKWPDHNIIATGHQPILYYPGILFKNYFAGKLAEECGGTALNFVVDTDAGCIEIPVPCSNSQGLYKKHVSIKSDENSVFSAFSISEKEVENFFSKTENCINSLDDDCKHIKASFNRYKKHFLQIFKSNRDFIDTSRRLRNEFELALGLELYDVKVSDITKTRAYNLFIYYIIENIKSFRHHFNEAINQCKSESYQPVKELCDIEGRCELPFWLIKDGLRYPLFARAGDAMLSLSSPGIDPEVNISTRGISDDHIAGEIQNRFTIYPKANMLTFMIRIFFSDLFIHGTGGVEYEKVNNSFLRSFFGLGTDLKYLSATGDIYLPLVNDLPDLDNFQKEYRKYQKWLREYKQKPESLLSPGVADKYKEKKKQIGSKMNEIARGKRKELNDQVEQLNEEMRKEYLQEEYKRTIEGLTQLEMISKNKNIYLERSYPYFIYPEEKMSPANFEDNLEVNSY